MSGLRLEELFEAAPGFMAVLRSPDHIFELVNPSYKRLIGDRDVIGRRAAEALPEVVEQGLIEVLDQVYASGEPFSAENAPVYLAKGDGRELRYLNFVYQPIRDESGEVSGIFCEGFDVTASAEANLARDAERRALEILNRTGADVASELDVDKVVKLVVDAGVELTKAKFGAFFYNVEAKDGERLMLYTLSGAEISDFERFGMPRPTPVFAPTFNGVGVIRSADITADPRYGKNAPHSGMPKGHLPVRSYLAVPVASRSGEVIGGLFFGHPEPDIFGERSERIMVGLAAQAAIAIDNARLFESARRANETLEQRVEERTAELNHANEALRQSQKLEAIGQLTGGIAHDFNNLLTVIRGSADILRNPELPEEKRVRYVEAIAETADRAARLTSQLLAFARRQSLEPMTFDVVDRIQALTTLLRPIMGSRVALKLDAECDPCFVNADPNQFDTAIVNMAVNARDAMDGEGELVVATFECSSIPAAGGQPAVPGTYTAVSLTDSGSGIPKEHLGRIFEPFFTTKEVGQGTGLGLSQVFGFAKQSSGEVRVDSNSEGTTFTLYLPKVEAPLEEEQRPQSARRAREVAGTILIVEDNQSVGEFARNLLDDLGYETILAPDGVAAVAILEDQAADIDAIFTDVVMPGMSGIELATHVRSRYPALPVVLTSGYSDVLASDGAHGFPLLHKPYSAASLTDALGAALSR